MSEWWTYSLTSFLLFSPRTYYRLFELYNTAIWPAQIFALVLGLTIVAIWRNGRVIAAILAAAWLFVAWAYLMERYASINWAAEYFAVGFVLEALLLVWMGVWRNGLLARNDAIGRAGFGLFLFALIGYPLIGPLLGRPWSQAEIIFVAPDPTVLATLGYLLAAGRAAWGLMIIPLVWCVISGATLWAMAVS